MANIILLNNKSTRQPPKASRTQEPLPSLDELVERLMAMVRQTQKTVAMAEEALLRTAALARYLPEEVRRSHAEQIAELRLQLDHARDVVRNACLHRPGG